MQSYVVPYTCIRELLQSPRGMRLEYRKVLRRYRFSFQDVARLLVRTALQRAAQKHEITFEELMQLPRGMVSSAIYPPSKLSLPAKTYPGQNLQYRSLSFVFS